jgi:predicted acetyltransferase
LALCLDRQTAVAVNTYLFQDHHSVSPGLPAHPDAHFRPATLDDAACLAQFYGDNNEYEDTEAIETGFGDRQQYALSLIEKEQVFLLTDHNEILGIGEYRPSQSQPPFADIGMITNHRFRRQGIGVYMLAQLKTHCYRQQTDPICSCAFDNIASRKTIEKAGFITQHRILDVQLQ